MKKKSVFLYFIFFWIFLLFFKFGGGLHYSLLSPLGERLMPLWIVGLIMSVASVLQLCLDVPAGKMLDRFGYKRLIVIGTFMFMITGSLLFFKFNSLFFILSVILSSFGWLFFGPGGNAYVLSHAKKGKVGKLMGYKDVSESIGIVLAAVTIPLIVSSSGKLISLIVFLLLTISFFAIILSPRDKKKFNFARHAHARTHEQRRHVLLNLFNVIKRLNPPSMILLLFQFVSAMFYGVIWFVIPLVIAHLPENSQLLGLGLGMFDFAVVITGALLCNFVDKSNKRKMVLLGLLMFSVFSMLLGLNYGLLFLVFAFLATVGDEVASLPLWAWMHSLDKKHQEDGLLSGVIVLFEDLGWAAGPLVAGILYTLIGSTWTIILGALPIMILLVIYYSIVYKRVIKFSIFDVPQRPHKRRHKG